jgi:GAF domain-containing protein
VQVTDSLQTSLHKPQLDSADLTDLLHFCIESILLTKPQTHDLRAAVFYVDTSGRYLVVPPNGYYGYALDQDITGLYFDIAPRQAPESDDTYLGRLGVAGWCYVKKRPVRSNDVGLSNTPYRYKSFPASQRDQPDRSMICIPIPNLNEKSTEQYIGVLAVSSLTPRVLTDNDVAIARFFATLLGRYHARLPAPLPPKDAMRSAQ